MDGTVLYNCFKPENSKKTWEKKNFLKQISIQNQKIKARMLERMGLYLRRYFLSNDFFSFKF